MLNKETEDIIKETFATSFKGARMLDREDEQDNIASVFATARLMARKFGLDINAFVPDSERLSGE
jgi:hypothetical protein